MAGQSARREYERRRAKDEQEIRDRWGPLGPVAVTLTPARGSTTSWAKGAEGEERLGARLDRLVSADIAVLHDRRIPRTRANIDHLVVTRSGVFVVDAKRYKGRPERRIYGGLLRPRQEHLVVGRRDCDRLLAGMHKQISHVRSAVPGVPVQGVLCFIEAEWPLFSSGFSVQGILVVTPRRLAKALARQVGSTNLTAVRDSLATAFPRA